MPTFRQNSDPIWFPHCPTCSVMISRGIFTKHYLSCLNSYIGAQAPRVPVKKTSYATTRLQDVSRPLGAKEAYQLGRSRTEQILSSVGKTTCMGLVLLWNKRAKQSRD